MSERLPPWCTSDGNFTCISRPRTCEVAVGLPAQLFAGDAGWEGVEEIAEPLVVGVGQGAVRGLRGGRR